MIDYAGAAKANLAWAALRRGDHATAEARAREAAALWSQIAYVYPFQAMGRLILAGAELGRGAVGEAVEHVRAILDPRQHALPEEIQTSAEQGILAWERGEADAARVLLLGAVEAARPAAYV